MQSPAPAPSVRSGFLRQWWWLYVVIAAIGLVALGVLFAPRAIDFRSDGGVTVVEDFFAAIEDKDVDAALKLVNSKTIPHGEEAAFLEPEAIADGWKLTSATVKESSIAADTVTATFDSELGSHSTDYTVTTGDRPQLVNPLIVVGFGHSPLNYAQVNGVTVPLKSDTDEEPAHFSLLPGIQTFYPDLPETVEMRESAPIEVFEDGDLDDRLIRPETATMPTTAALDEEVNSGLSQCAESSRAWPKGCPFGVTEYLTTDDAELRELSRLKWEIAETVDVTLTAYDPDAEFYGLGIETDPARPVRLSGTGQTRDGDSVDFTVECSVNPRIWMVLIDEHGELKLTDNPAADESADNSLGTCSTET